MNGIKKTIYIITCFLFLSCNQSVSLLGKVGNETVDKEVFNQPTRNNYPETWFHLIGGNASKKGITADLEAIAKGGFSGIQLFQGQFGGPWPGVSPQIEILSESWDDLIVWTASECDRLGLRFTMQNCPGWSYAGGPWIEPSNAMRHLVQSRTDITGGENITVALDTPQPSEENWRDYKDLFVIAFPTPEGDTGEKMIPSKITSNQAGIAWDDLFNDDKTIQIPASEPTPTVIDFVFDSTTMIRTVELPPVKTFASPWSYNPSVGITIFANINGSMEQVAHMDMPASNWQDDQPLTIACKETLTDSYRIEIENKYDINVDYINFYTAARQQNWESEAAWTLREIVREEFPEQSRTAWIDTSNLLDITSEMDSLGILSWEAAEGDWTILRVGHVNTGRRNGPAPARARGWESNKLAASGARANFDGYIGRLINENESLKNGMLDGILIDSWECKTQTWTEGLNTIFHDKWDYSLISMLPAIFGYVVNDPATTSLFLIDWRTTLNDLLVENFFGEMHEIAHEHDLRLSFETASGDVFPGDILEYYKYADVPMCEFWQSRTEASLGSIEYKPVKPAVSASRVYGKGRVAAEAFTSTKSNFPGGLTWKEHPGFLKDFADDHFARGVTHMVFHTYTHNPRTDFLPPGSSMGTNIGTPFMRLQTWWEHIPYFTDYLARCNYMLESGNPVSDVLMYLGDEINHKPKQSLDFPYGYAYDYCNKDVLLNRLSVKDGKFITPEGISYRVLWLQDCKRMLPETLEKIYSFVKQGGILVGEPPAGIATLSGGEKSRQYFLEAKDALWGNSNEKRHKVGRGQVYNDKIEAALLSENIKPDINVRSSDLRWLHRETNDSDIYFLSAPADKEGFKGEVVFRSEGAAEIWNPMSGESNEISYTISEGFTSIDLDIPAGSSFFVVLQKNSTKKTRLVAKTTIVESSEIKEPWQIQFPTGWGIKNDPVKVDNLISWKDLPLSREGQSFSGTAIYKTTFNMDEIKREANYLLDLGRVEVIARILLNGSDVTTKWTYPYEADITNYIRTGENTLEVEVTSTWFNRLVFDAGLPEAERKTWTIEGNSGRHKSTGPQPDSKLEDYGLLGPVLISTEI